MKKTKYFIMIFIVMLGLSACGNSNGDAPSNHELPMQSSTENSN